MKNALDSYAFAIIGVCAVLYGGWTIYQQHVAQEEARAMLLGTAPPGSAGSIYAQAQHLATATTIDTRYRKENTAMTADLDNIATQFYKRRRSLQRRDPALRAEALLRAASSSTSSSPGSSTPPRASSIPPTSLAA